MVRGCSNLQWKTWSSNFFSTERVAVINFCFVAGPELHYCGESQFLVSVICLNRGLKEWGEERIHIKM